MKKITLLISGLILAFSTANAQITREAYEKEYYVEEGDSLPYRVLYPENFNPKKEYPVILFLHGAGERGYDNERQLALGGDLFLKDDIRKEYPAIVVFPQCDTKSMWTNRTKRQRKNNSWEFQFPTPEVPSRPTQLLINMLDEFVDNDYVDTDRIYVMGISMGGIGTLEMLYRFPKQFAAAAVICGGNDKDLAKEYKKVPIWFFHGEADDVVPPIYSKQVFDAVKDKNRHTRYTSYPNTNHNSWDKALAEPDLLKWMFQFKN